MENLAVIWLFQWRALGDKWAHTPIFYLLISHLNLSNIGTNTHAQIDSFIADFSLSSLTSKDILRYNGTNFVNVQDLVTGEANIATLQCNYTTLQYSTGTMKTNSNTTQNTAIVTTYVDGTDNNITNVNNAAPY